MIRCAKIECKYNGENSECKCKEVILSNWCVNTVNMGNKEFWECKSYKESKEYKRLKKKLVELGII